MKVLMFITDDLGLRQLFIDYDELVKKIFATVGKKQHRLIEEANGLFSKIENRISAVKDGVNIRVMDGSFYEVNIKDDVPKNLLMNGIYNRQELGELLKKYRESLTSPARDMFNGIVNSLGHNEYIFIWNTGEENIDEILQNN